MYDVIFPNLGIKIKTLPKVFISVGNFNIYWYAVLLTLGVVCGFLFVLYEAKRTGQDKDTYIEFLNYTIISGIIGARTYYVIFSWDLYKDNLWGIFNIRQGGMAVYGTIIAGIITGIVYVKIKKLNFLLFADTCALGLSLGQAVGRWCNFPNREAFGGYTNSIFAMCYKLKDVLFVPEDVLEKAVLIDNVQYIQVHPAFLYESICSFVVFAILNLFKKHKKFDGEVFALYFIGYGISRAFVESLRKDSLLIWQTNIAVSQVVSVMLAVFGLIFIVYNRKIRTK